MKTITVKASRNYDVLIGNGLLASLGEHAARLTKAKKAAIISDSNVWPLYGHIAVESLNNSGFDVLHYTFPAGESSKNGSTYLSILNFLAENHVTRTDCLIALGGGVVGDMTGFVAATYLRGIAYIQVPTTLLAAVDSSVGGKTAIDLPAGKNLAGAFCQPSMVLCDTDTLNTLPPEIFLDGCAEVIKMYCPDCRIIAVEPYASPVLSGGFPGGHPLAGIGPGFVPEVLNTYILDEVIRVKTPDSLHLMGQLAAQEGLLCGPSSGAALAAAISVAQRPEAQGKTVVTILPDVGERYLTEEF